MPGRLRVKTYLKKMTYRILISEDTSSIINIRMHGRPQKFSQGGSVNPKKAPYKDIKGPPHRSKQ